MDKISKDVLIYETPSELARAAGELFIEICDREVKRKGSFSVAISGGTTPGLLYALLASDGLKGRIPWEKVHVFWGDERCVGPDSPESNYRMARISLLSRVNIPEENIHRIKGEARPEEAALLYEKEIKEFFGRSGDAGGAPSFDLILLGLGEDGHTLSLFPGTEALNEKRRLVVENYVEHLDSWRITMTFALANMAANIVFLVSGKKKARILKEVLHDAAAGAPYPAKMIRPPGGNLLWLVDREAAGLL